MKSVYVKFNNKEDISDFVNILCRYDYDFDLVKGRKMVDAKSYLGILCFDLADSVRLDIHDDNEGVEEVIASIASYIVEE